MSLPQKRPASISSPGLHVSVSLWSVGCVVLDPRLYVSLVLYSGNSQLSWWGFKSQLIPASALRVLIKTADMFACYHRDLPGVISLRCVLDPVEWHLLDVP